MMDTAIARPIQATQTSDIAASARVIVAASVPPPRGGRSLTSRAAIVTFSDGLQLRPGILSNVETSAFSAVTLGIAERRAASSHGSTSACANAERTVICVPLGASSITVRRKSLHSGEGIEVRARSIMTTLPFGHKLQKQKRTSGVSCSNSTPDRSDRGVPLVIACCQRSNRWRHDLCAPEITIYASILLPNRRLPLDSSQTTCRR